MYSAAKLSSSTFRRFCTAASRRIHDEGDWCYSSEWWGSDHPGRSVFRSNSDKGNGVVSVLTYPASTPDRVYWEDTERWLNQRLAETQPSLQHTQEEFRIRGYEWRVLRFNEDTRQSIAKVMAASRKSENHDSVYLMQLPHCLATPYLKSMVSAGLPTLASCGFDVASVASAKKTMRILCVGHGGGSLPLFLASSIRGAIVDVVEIDPVVISASVEAMGFPAFSVVTSSGEQGPSKPNATDEVMWKGVHERIFLYESDAEKFMCENENIYDLVFMDAYDGNDIFSRKLWDPKFPFLNDLSNHLHPEHGTVVVNLHSDCELLGNEPVSHYHEQPLPVGKYVTSVGQAYKNALFENTSGKYRGALAFTVSVPWTCNTSLVVCRGRGVGKEYIYNRDLVMNTLVSKSLEVDRVLNLPFSCLKYILRGLLFLE
ncbi:hypothetical protein ACFE04_008777 [Oxalis oulophora]